MCTLIKYLPTLRPNVRFLAQLPVERAHICNSEH
jgi:hypothetical protein